MRSWGGCISLYCRTDKVSRRWIWGIPYKDEGMVVPRHETAGETTCRNVLVDLFIFRRHPRCSFSNIYATCAISLSIEIAFSFSNPWTKLRIFMFKASRDELGEYIDLLDKARNDANHTEAVLWKFCDLDSSPQDRLDHTGRDTGKKVFCTVKQHHGIISL